MAKAKPEHIPEPLPLNSAHWVGMDVAAEWLYERLRNGDDVARDLTEAMAQDRLRCMGRDIRSGERRLISHTEWDVIELCWWGIDPERRERTVQPHYRERINQESYRRRYDATLYIWWPDFEAIWPAFGNTAGPPKIEGQAVPFERIAPPPHHEATEADPPRGRGGREPEHAWNDAIRSGDETLKKEGGRLLPLKEDGSPNITRGVEMMMNFFETEPKPPEARTVHRWIQHEDNWPRVRHWWGK